MKRLISVALVLVLLMSFICGCKSTDPENGDPVQASEVVNIISNETLVDLIRLNLIRTASANQAKYLEKLESMAEITVTDYAETENNISASVTIVAPNMYNIAKDIENEPFTDADSLDESICARLDSNEDFVTKTCSVSFYYAEEDWVADFSEEFFDALYGGLFTYRNEYVDSQEVQ